MKLHEFFEYLFCTGLLLFACSYLPFQFISYWRRKQRKHKRLSCRLCSYRFLRRDAEGTCPHCQAKNG